MAVVLRVHSTSALADSLRQIRTSRNLTQKVVAQKLGISQQVYSRYEKTGRMSTEMLFLILKVLKAQFELVNLSLESKNERPKMGLSRVGAQSGDESVNEDIVLKRYQDLSDDD